MKTNFVVATVLTVLLVTADSGRSQNYGGPPPLPQGQQPNRYPTPAYSAYSHPPAAYPGYPTPGHPAPAGHGTYQTAYTNAPASTMPVRASAGEPLENKEISALPPASITAPAVHWSQAKEQMITVSAESVVTKAADSSAAGCGCTDGGCAGGGCDGGCTSSACTACCGSSNCVRNPCHQLVFIGEYLYLRPRNAEINFASQIDGPVDPDQTPTFRGTVGNVDPDFSSGYRLGVAMHWDDTSSLIVTGTRYENSTSNVLTNNPGDVLFPTTMHPTTFNAATSVLQASAAYSMDFDLIDTDFRSIWRCGHNYQVNYTLGVRYTRFDQDFAAQYVFNNTDNVISSASFDGAGIRFGLDGERFRCGNTGLSLYSKVFANFLAGQARGQFLQQDTGGVIRVTSDWEAGRVMTQLDAELGIGWTSCCENWKLQAGYMFSGWFNTVQVADIIEAAHANQYDGIGSTISFDGLTARIEYRY